MKIRDAKKIIINLVINSKIIRYVFFGGLTTLVNLVMYYILRILFLLPVNFSNIISIFSAILFAYYANAKYVFNNEKENVFTFKQFYKFLASRLSTMAIEVIGVIILVDYLDIDDYICKILIQVIILILNFVLSKLFIFKSYKL